MAIKKLDNVYYEPINRHRPLLISAPVGNQIKHICCLLAGQCLRDFQFSNVRVAFTRSSRIRRTENDIDEWCSSSD